MNEVMIKCGICGIEARDIDEIIVIFGFQKIKKRLIPYKICKQCRKQGINNNISIHKEEKPWLRN